MLRFILHCFMHSNSSFFSSSSSQASCSGCSSIHVLYILAKTFSQRRILGDDDDVFHYKVVDIGTTYANAYPCKNNGDSNIFGDEITPKTWGLVSQSLSAPFAT